MIIPGSDMLILLGGPPAHDRAPIAYIVSSLGSSWTLNNEQSPLYPQSELKAYSSVAALAQRLANPDEPAHTLLIPNLDALDTGSPYLRRVRQQDFSPTELNLASLVVQKKRLPECLIIDSLSRLYEQVMVETTLAASRTLPHDKIHPTSQFHASEAMSRLCWDLAKSPQWIIGIMWDVEMYRSGKVTGHAPQMPKSALGQAHLWLQKEPQGLVVKRSMWSGIKTGAIIDEGAAWDWLTESSTGEHRGE